MLNHKNHIPLNPNKIGGLPDLKPGDSHPDIIEVQSLLKRFGYLDEEDKCIAGEVCKLTESAIRDYQRFYGLPINGEIDEITRNEMTIHRCGMPDNPALTSFATIGGWNRRNITYAFGADTNSAVSMQDARGAVRRAFDTYESAGVGLSFTEVSNNPDIQVEWSPTVAADHNMTGGTIAHADFPPGFSINVNGLPLPLHFDDGEVTWVDGAVVGSLDIESVALHEIGHCLGLLHTGVAGSIMFPQIASGSTQRIIQPDDMAALRALYPINGSLDASASWGPNRYDIFGVAQNGDVLQLWWDGQWHRANLGNGFQNDRFTGQLSAASWGHGRLDVFGLGENGNMLQMWWDGRQWNWANLGNNFSDTRFLGPISVASWGPNRYDIFGYDAIGNILQLWWDGSQWNWANLGNNWGVPANQLLIGQVAAASWGKNRLDIFSLDQNGNVLQLWWDGSQWNWANLGNNFVDNKFVGSVTATSWGSGRLDVFGLGENGDVLQLAWNGHWHWLNLKSNFPSDQFSGMLTASSWGRNRIDIFGLGLSDDVLQLWWDGRRRNWTWSNLGPLA